MKTTFLNLMEQKFGKLLVIEEVGRNNGVIWKCKCECGKETIVRSSHLRSGQVKSCGCTRSASIQKALRKEPFRWLYTRLTISANYYRKPIDLTFQEFLGFTKITQCEYCDSPIQWKPYSDKKHAGYNIDRKDNSKGYTKENCVVCCSQCNRVKNNSFSHEEMRKLGSCIKEILKSRS